MYGSTLACMSPGRKPSRSPASTAGRLAGLYRGAREDDPPDLPCRERGDREGDREVRLARAGGADRERHGVTADRVDVALLRDRLRGDLLPAVAPDDVFEDVADVLGLVERAEDRVDGRRPDVVAAFDEVDELVDDRARLSAW